MYPLDFALIIASFGLVPATMFLYAIESRVFAANLQTTRTDRWHQARVSLTGPLASLQTRLVQAELRDGRLRGGVHMAAPLGGRYHQRRWPYGFELTADGRLRWRSAVHLWQLAAPVINLLVAAMLVVPSVHLVYLKHMRFLSFVPVLGAGMAVYAVGMLATRGWRTRRAERRLVATLQAALEEAQAQQVEVA